MRRYRAEDRGQHPQTGVLLRRFAVFDADFGKEDPRWVTRVPRDTPLSEGATDGPNWADAKRREQAAAERLAQHGGLFWYSSGSVFR